MAVRRRRFSAVLVVALLVAVFGLVAPAGAQSAPTVTSVSPTSGPLAGGQVVTITGTNFTGTTAVQIGGTNATSFAVVSATSIVAVVPARGAAGAQLITVTNGTGTNATGSSYTYVGPTITSISPAFADADTEKIVTIVGTGFTGVTASDVLFGTNEALRAWVVSDTRLIVETPVNDANANPAIVVADGVTDVTVANNSVTSATGAGSKFLFAAGVPTITSLGATGTDGVAIGANLTITGTRLWGVSKVRFGSTVVTTPADIVVANDGNSLTVKVPTRTSGPVDVVVENSSGLSVTHLDTVFNYYSTADPKITTVTPSVLHKTNGGTFLVTGSGFTGVGTSDVVIACATDLTPTAVTPVSDTSLIVTSPGNSGTAATCDLEITNANDANKSVVGADLIRFV